MRVLRIPHSTNVERVALALGHKGLAVEWVDVDPDDRAPVRALSGQDLVPVLELDDGEVLADSRAILRRLEADHPEPPLWPGAPGRPRAGRRLRGVVRRGLEGAAQPPGRRARGSARPDDAERLRGWTDRFEALLATGAPYLLGDAVTVADVLAQPFLRYGAVPPAADDRDPFHAVLAEHLPIRTGPYPRLRAGWRASTACRGPDGHGRRDLEAHVEEPLGRVEEAGADCASRTYLASAPPPKQHRRARHQRARRAFRRAQPPRSPSPAPAATPAGAWRSRMRTASMRFSRTDSTRIE